MRNLKRMPNMVLTEENLRNILNEETMRLNLENHYWLKNSFIDKIGRMAPNLQELSLRRMTQISNPVFADMFHQLKHLVSVDLSDCVALQTSALQLMLRNNLELE